MARQKRDPLAQILERRILGTRVVMTWERFLYAFWLPLCIIALTFVLYRWGVFEAVEAPIQWALYAVLAASGAYSVYQNISKFGIASRAAAIQRMDIHHVDMPITALKDNLALQADDPETQELWELHKSRMAAEAAKAKVPSANVRLSKNDPWAVRLVALLALFSAGLFADPDAARRALSADGADLTPAGPRFEIWARPLDYTGQPTVYLNDVAAEDVIRLPVNSEILLRSYAPAGELSLSESITTTASTKLSDEGADLQSVTFIATTTGLISVIDADGEDRAWAIEIIPDLPPEIKITGEMTRSLAGAMRLPFQARDDYGVTGGDLRIQLDLDAVERRFGFALEPEHRDDLTSELPLPFLGDLSTFDGVIEEDYAQHPWAGLPIQLELSVRDAANAVGAIDPLNTVLAKKRFFDPLAAAIVDIRAQILWNRENLDRADYLLRAISYQPEGVFNQQKAFLLTRSVIRRIGYLQQTDINDDEVIQKIAEQLWQAALLIEHGDLNDAEERLKRAQERLNEAMENGATPEEIQELMNELREATREYLRQLAQNAERREQQASNAPQGQPITQDQLQEMMDRIQELMEQGRMEEAQELLRQLQEMLENAQVVEQQGSGGQGEQGLQDTLREQQDLADDTFRQLQEQFDQRQQQNGQNQNGQQQGQQDGQGQGQDNLGPSQNGGDEQSLSDLAERQEALRQMLEDQRGGVQNDGSAAGQEAEQSLGNAEESMQGAEDAIREGDLGEALNQQAEALDELRQGMRALNDQQANADGTNGQGDAASNEGGGQEGDSAINGSERDPLGRPNRVGTADGPGSRMTLDGGSARIDFENLKSEIEKRLMEQERPSFELDYLDRLLDRF